MMEQNVQDLSGEVDLDFVDMQDHKFMRGEYVDKYEKKYDKSLSYQVEVVLDEMIYMKSVSMSHDNFQ